MYEYSLLDHLDGVPASFRGLTVYLVTGRDENIAQLLGARGMTLIPPDMHEKLGELRGTHLIEL